MIPGEAWQDIMMALSNNDKEGPVPRCITSIDKEGVPTFDPKDLCGQWLAFPYFISFSLLCTFLVSSYWLRYGVVRLLLEPISKREFEEALCC